jgi:hypothetical protein
MPDMLSASANQNTKEVAVAPTLEGRMIVISFALGTCTRLPIYTYIKKAQ